MGGLNYEPRIIEAHAQRLERRAESMGVTSTFIGVVIGGFFGAVPLTSLGDSWPVPSQFGFATLLVGMLIGALTGYVIGDARAFGYRLQAQSSLCQLHLERNTAALLARAHQESRSMNVLLSDPEPTVEAHIEPAPALAEYTEPEPEPAPLPVLIPLYLEPEPATLADALALDLAELQPEPEPEPEPIDEVTPDPAWFTEPQSDLEPMPEPARLVEVLWPDVLEAGPEPIRLAEAPRLDFAESLPEPEPAPEPAPPAPAAEATPTPADLESMSLEEIARLSNSGLI